MRVMSTQKSAPARIGIVGGGFMGADLFNFFSESDLPTVWVVRNEEKCRELSVKYARKCERLVRSRALSEACMRSRIDSVKIASAAGALEDCDIVLEAITEEVDAKRDLFNVIEKVVRDSTLLVTTTSSIRPSMLSEGLSRGERFAAVHFFYPVKLKNIAEVVLPDSSSMRTRDMIRSLFSAVGRRFIELPDHEAFLLNRVLLDYQAAAYRIHLEMTIPLYRIDEMVKHAIHPAGVFEFFDGVGIDVARASVSAYTECVSDPGFYAPLLGALARLAQSGRKGKKSGAGFHDYPLKTPESPTRTDDNDISLLLLAIFINSCFRAMELGVCPDRELDNAIRESMGIDNGPLALSEMMGRVRLRAMLNDEYRRTGHIAMRPSEKW